MRKINLHLGGNIQKNVDGMNSGEKIILLAVQNSCRIKGCDTHNRTGKHFKDGFIL